MTNREQLIQELEQAPDDLVLIMLDFLHRVKAIRKNHPLAKFAGILSDTEAEELQQTLKLEFRQEESNQPIPPTITDIAARQDFLTQLVQQMQQNPLPANAPRFTRDMLHERR